jgi:hypothetical protein
LCPQAPRSSPPAGTSRANTTQLIPPSVSSVRTTKCRWLSRLARSPVSATHRTRLLGSVASASRAAC